MTIPLLSQLTTQTFDIAGGGRVVLHRRWLHTAHAGVLLLRLQRSVDWQHRTIRVYGRPVKQPRLTAWWGDPEATYVYSGIANEPQAWPSWLLSMCAEVERATGARYNSCLGNLYRDGRDSVALHADDEPELGPEPTIASLSLGASRKFRMQHVSGDGYDLTLDDGDLLVMSGPMQREWKHGVPKMARVDGPRVNLTFRWVEAR